MGATSLILRENGDWVNRVMQKATMDAVLDDYSITDEEVEALVASFTAKSLTHVTIAQLLEIGRNTSPGVRRILKIVMEKRRGLAGREQHSLIPVFYIETLLRWYERKCCQRLLLVSYSRNKECIEYHDFEKYVMAEHNLRISRLERESDKVCYTTMAMVGICLPMGKKNSMNIKELLCSTLLDDMDVGVEVSDRKNDGKASEIDNWFSIQNSFFLVNEYKECDLDMNGMLDQKELQNMHDGIFNPAFIRGMIRTNQTYFVDGSAERQVDFHCFATLHRATRHMSSIYRSRNIGRQERPCVQWVFNCLDEHCAGFLSRSEIMKITQEMFLAAVLMDVMAGSIEVEAVVDEVFDMANPEDKTRITVDDLMQSGMANTVLGILIDAKRFLQYEDRESFDDSPDQT